MKCNEIHYFVQLINLKNEKISKLLRSYLVVGDTCACQSSKYRHRWERLREVCKPRMPAVGTKVAEKSRSMAIERRSRDQTLDCGHGAGHKTGIVISSSTKAVAHQLGDPMVS